MSDRRRTWVRSVLRSLGRGLVNGLTAMGACTCAGAATSAALRMDRRELDHGEVGIRDQAAQGIAEIEAYLAAVDPPARRADEPPRRRRRRDAT